MGNGYIVLIGEANGNRAFAESVARCEYAVHAAPTAEQALPWMRRERLAGVVVSIDDVSGVRLIRDVAGRTAEPIIAACPQSQEELVVACLEAGADAVLTHPLSLLELQARLDAALAHPAGGNRARPRPEHIAAGDLTIDVGARTVSRRGEVLPLTPTEYSLLLALAGRDGDVVSHAELMSTVWPGSHGVTSGNLRLFIKSLREKMADTSSRQLILTQRGRGYSFAGIATNGEERNLGRELSFA